jgi:hypothetical protein
METPLQELTNLLTPLYSNSLDLKEKSREAIQKIKTSAANTYDRVKNISIRDIAEIIGYTTAALGIGSLAFGTYGYIPNPSPENFAFVGAGLGLLLAGRLEVYIASTL